MKIIRRFFWKPETFSESVMRAPNIIRYRSAINLPEKMGGNSITRIKNESQKKLAGCVAAKGADSNWCDQIIAEGLPRNNNRSLRFRTRYSAIQKGGPARPGFPRRKTQQNTEHPPEDTQENVNLIPDYATEAGQKNGTL